MLLAGSPNMNSLVSLGATTSFLGGAATALLPGMNTSGSFLEEPVMLLAVVLLGRTLEARARARASGDLRCNSRGFLMHFTRYSSSAAIALPPSSHLVKGTLVSSGICRCPACRCRSLAALIPASSRLVMDLGRKDATAELLQVPTSEVR